MKSKLLNTASAAMFTVGILAAPLAYAQSADPNAPAATQTPGTNGGADTMPSTGQGNAASPGAPAGTTSGTPTPGATNSMSTADAGSTMPFAQLQDRPIQNPQGEDLADLDDVIVSPDGRITDAVVSFGGFLGLGAKKVKVSWQEFTFDNGKKVLVLAKSNDEINAMPDYKEPDAPPQPDSRGNADTSSGSNNGTMAPAGGAATGTGTGTGGTSAP
ncbi:PRC-barrel domain-containing protein [Segnochrobactrum spirostomi]|uniref:PRC-barrel domain containing protein n=1 Tax=Segnochrobactrum spirostomi TaxID=2608987 RepID=A0A6A7Y3P0_9HYPH|nr:PRC-barrel domain-containing protein [Segnochrobactrum spirostomi]MQT12352.1 PRC-barrel domain containing protein [Segnochrobactrum spirostomi]